MIDSIRKGTAMMLPPGLDVRRETKKQSTDRENPARALAYHNRRDCVNYRYGWWPYVQSMVRNYPQRMNCAGLGKIEQREAEAVSEAIRQTEQREDGAERLRLIRKLYWSRHHQTISGAALDLYISRATANRWHSDFIYLVAESFGLYIRK